MDPAQGAGIKIPDDVAIQTGTLQCVEEITFVTNANEFGGCRAFCLLPNAVSASSGENWQTHTAAASATNVLWGDAEPLATTPALQAYSDMVRVCSAALYVESEASLASASGEMILGYTPYSFTSDPNLVDWRNAYGTSIMPLNACQGMKVLWTPVSKEQQTYSAFTSPSLTEYGGGDDQVPLYSLWVLVNGVPVGTSFRVRLVVNYEFVPKENSIDILSANPSPCDSSEVDLTEAWVAQESVTRPASAAEMSRSPGATIQAKQPQDGGETGFGMFANILAELAPYVLEGAMAIL